MKSTIIRLITMIAVTGAGNEQSARLTGSHHDRRDVAHEATIESMKGRPRNQTAAAPRFGSSASCSGDDEGACPL